MSRSLIVLLALVMLLAGCASTTTPVTTPTENIQGTDGIYIPDSSIEQETNGAVRVFRLGEGNYYGCAMVGSELLLIHNRNGEGYFTLYQGEKLVAVKTADLGADVVPETEKLQINDQGIGYFDRKNKDVVFLNHNFAETGRIHLPDQLQGDAWLTPDWKLVYYCTDSGVYVMDLQTGISRLLREQKALSQSLTGGFGNGEVVRCVVQTSETETKTLLIDGKTGVQLNAGAHFDNLVTDGSQYYLPHLDRGVMFLRFGTQQEHQVLWPAEQSAETAMIFAENAMVTIQREEGSTQLSCYGLETGNRAAAVTLEGVEDVWGFAGDGKGGIWMYGKTAEGTALYCWNYELSSVGDDAVYTAPYYAPEAPDETGLAALIAQAKSMGQKYGVEILLWQDAAATVPQNQVFTAEHITQLYEYYLPRLEQVLQEFPAGFFTKTVDQKLKIVLLRDITGDPEQGTLSQVEQVQFWNKKLPVVAVTLGENFERNLLHGLYLYMETRLLSKSSALYEWYRMNPSDFVYDDDYIANLKRIDTTYIEGENPYFINLFSMSFAREDRATIFEYACQPGNEEYFKRPVLQEKLKRICKGIREAYGLKKVTTEFLWEQYLEK